MTARFAVAAGDHLSAFLQDATTGIAARCTDINTRESDALLPTTWNFPDHKRPRQPRLPFCAVSFEESDIVARQKVAGKYPYLFTVVLGVGKQHTFGSPATEEAMKRRLEWMLREVFDEEAAWHGYNLAGRVVDAWLGPIGGGLVRLEEFGEERAVMMGGLCRITLYETHTHP